MGFKIHKKTESTDKEGYRMSESPSSRNLVDSMSFHSGHSKSVSTQRDLQMSRRQEFLSLASYDEDEERIHIKDIKSRREKERFIKDKLCGFLSNYTTLVVLTELIQPKEFYLGKELELEYEKSLFKIYRYMLFAGYICLALPKLIMYLLIFLQGITDAETNTVIVEKYNYTFIILLGATLAISSLFVIETCIPFIYKKPLLIKINMYLFIIFETATSITLSIYEGATRFRFFPILIYLTFYPVNTGIFMIYAVVNVGWLMVLNVIHPVHIEKYISDIELGITIQFIGILTARMASYASRRRFVNAQFTKQRNKELLFEMKKNDILLRNILPEKIIKELSQEEASHDMTTTNTSSDGDSIIYNSYEDVAVLFIKINNFNKLTEKLHADEIVQLLNYVFVTFDNIVEQYGIWRVKTIGQTYMAACGIPELKENPVDVLLDAALSCLHFIKAEDIVESLQLDTTEKLTVSIGINHGPLVAGVIGVNAFIYDIWGDTVNIASRMAYTLPYENTIQMDYNLYGNLIERIGADVAFDTYGPYKVCVKGIGEMECASIRGYAGDAKPAFIIEEGRIAIEQNSKSSILSILRKTVRKNHRLDEFKEDEEVLPLEKMAKMISKEVVEADLESNVNHERTFWQLMIGYVVPVLVVFKNCRLNPLFFMNNYKYYTTTNRGLHFISVLIYLSSIGSDVAIISSDRYNGMLSMKNLLIFKVGVASAIVLILNLLTLTPLYKLRIYTFMPMAVVTLWVTILASCAFSFFAKFDVFTSVILMLCTLLWYYFEGLHYWMRSIFALICSVLTVGGQIYHNDRDGLQFTVGLMIITQFIGNFHMFFSVLPQMDDAMTKVMDFKKSKYLGRKKKNSSKLLNSILPPSLIQKLSTPSIRQVNTAEFYESTSVLFSDICNFTKLSHSMTDQNLIKMLNFLFSNLDILAEKNNIQKVKTIGDSYECVAGAPIVSHNHFIDMLNFGLDLLALVKRYKKFEMRVGIASGPLVSGVIGINKIAFDIFGFTVRKAELLEQTGAPMELHVSLNTKIGANKTSPGAFAFRPNRELDEPELINEQSFFVTKITKQKKRTMELRHQIKKEDPLVQDASDQEDVNDETHLPGTPHEEEDEREMEDEGEMEV